MYYEHCNSSCTVVFLHVYEGIYVKMGYSAITKVFVYEFMILYIQVFLFTNVFYK